MAGGIEPQRAVLLPDRQKIRRLAGAAAFVAGAARPEILRGRRSHIGAETEAFVRERDRAIRIALAGGDAVAETGNQDVAHPDFGREVLRGIGACGDVDGGNRLAAVAHAQIDRLGAIERRLLRAAAVIEGPGAGGADRNLAGEAHGDRMVGRRQIVFLHIVAGAGLADAALQIDAEPVDHVARPAAAVALQFQRLLGGENAAAFRGIDMDLEIAFLPEQAEAVTDFPRNLHGRVGIGLRDCRPHRQFHKRSRKQRDADDQTETTTNHDAFDVTVPL